MQRSRQWREGWQGYLPRAVLPEAQDSPWIQWVELAFNTARATVLNECPRETWVLLRQQTPRIPSESPEQIQDYLWSGGRAYLFYMHAVSVEVLQVRSCVYCPRRKHARIGNLFRTWWKGDWGFLLYASVWCSDDVVFFFFFFWRYCINMIWGWTAAGSFMLMLFSSIMLMLQEVDKRLGRNAQQVWPQDKVLGSTKYDEAKSRHFDISI